MKQIADFMGAQILAEGLSVIGDTQELVSGLVPGATNTPLSQSQVSTYILALLQEVHEFGNELGWKPWKVNDFDPEKAADEFADILAFLGLFVHLLEKGGVTPEMLANAYRKKSINNVGRFLGLPDSKYHGTINSEEKRALAISIMAKLSD